MYAAILPPTLRSLIGSSFAFVCPELDLVIFTSIERRSRDHCTFGPPEVVRSYSTIKYVNFLSKIVKVVINKIIEIVSVDFLFLRSQVNEPLCFYPIIRGHVVGDLGFVMIYYDREHRRGLEPINNLWGRGGSGGRGSFIAVLTAGDDVDRLCWSSPSFPLSQIDSGTSLFSLPSMAAGAGDGESSPLLGKPVEDAEKKANKVSDAKIDNVFPQVKFPAPMSVGGGAEYGWPADSLPLVQGSVVGEPIGRSQWNSSLFACLGRNDEFCSSDFEVCLLGSITPCVLYGSNVERFNSAPGNFASLCLSYSSLYLIGNSLFGWNCLAPWFSYPTRTAIRRKFNLEGSCEAFHRSCGCCGSYLENDFNREQCETACDFMTHVFCHACALCQEGREVRRRIPHPGFNAQPVLVMIPPGEQAMARGL